MYAYFIKLLSFIFLISWPRFEIISTLAEKYVAQHTSPEDELLRKNK